MIGPDCKLYGEKIFRLRPDKPRRNAREVHGLQGFWQTDDENYFTLGDAPPDKPNMRIVEIESDLEIEGNAYEQRIQCEGILDDSTWIETGYEEDLPEEGWDTIAQAIYTRTPTDARWRKGSRVEQDPLYGISGSAPDGKCSYPEHGLTAGQVVIPEFISGFGGITSGSDYFFGRINANQFSLCASKACALVAAVTPPGAPAAITGNVGTGRIAWTAHGLSDGDVVLFLTLTGGSGITALLVPYYVINSTTDDFQLSLTAGGAAVSLGSNISAGTCKAGSGIALTSDGDSMMLRPVQLGFELCWITERRKRKARAKGYWELDLQLKGIKQEADDSKPVKRRISTTGQTMSNDTYSGESILPYWVGFPPVNMGTVNFSPPVIGDTIAAEFDLPQISVTDTMISTSKPPTSLVPGFWVPEDAPIITVLSTFSDDYTYHCPYGWKVINLQSEQIPGQSLWLLSITWGYQIPKSPRTSPAA